MGPFLKSPDVVAPNFNQNLLRCNDTCLLWAPPSVYIYKGMDEEAFSFLAGQSPSILALEPTSS